MVPTGLYELTSITTTLFDRPQANRILESSGVNVKCQHLFPVGTSASSWSEPAENTWSLPARELGSRRNRNVADAGWAAKCLVGEHSFTPRSGLDQAQ
jgi:hypothetical protein